MKSSTMRYESLRQTEQEMLTIGPLLISTVTWLNGNHEQAAVCLQERLTKLVQANPWLTGKIVRRHWYSTNSCLAYDATKADQATAHGLFRHVTVQESSLLGIDMDASTPLDEVADVCRKLDWLVRPGHNHAVYALTVVATCQDDTASNDTTFAVIASMSHIVGDGHTFYALYNYLVGAAATNENDNDDNVPTLQVTRVAAATRNDVMQFPLLRPLHTHALGFLIPATIGLVVGKLRAIFSRQYRVERRYLYFDMAAIERLKQQAIANQDEKDDANVNFVSTNDVITSWVLRNAKCRHGFMVANWRGRVDGYTDRLAGNYFTLLYHDLANNQKTVMTPSTIRRSIVQCTAAPTSGTATRSPPSVVPSPSRFWVGGPFIVSSSLASFGSHTITLPAGSHDNRCCRQVLHARITSRTELDMHPAHFVYALVFCANSINGQLGMMLCGSPSRLDGLTSENCPFAAKL